MPKKITVNDDIQKNYSYDIVAGYGKDFQKDFEPQLTPKQMLELGVFGGHYLNDCISEYPKDWFENARLSDHGPDAKYNYFEVTASQPLKVWQEKGWIYPDDPRGWFQWYCRYFVGRRIPTEDQRQIKRWVAMKRHTTQLRNACIPGDLTCRRRQRQAVMHWSYDSRKI